MSRTGKVIVPCNHDLLREAIADADMSTHQLAVFADCSHELVSRLRSRGLASRRWGCSKEIADRIEAALGREGLFGPAPSSPDDDDNKTASAA